MIPGANIDDKRGLRKRCTCGRFNVRRIYNRDETETYSTPKATAGHQHNTRTHFNPSRPHPDGLCERCATYGDPDYQEQSTTGNPIRGSYRRGDAADGRRQLAKIGINLNERRKFTTGCR